MQHAGLRRLVAGRVGLAGHAGHRAHVDDRAPPALEHERQHGSHTEEHAREVQVERRPTRCPRRPRAAAAGRAARRRCSRARRVDRSPTRRPGSPSRLPRDVELTNLASCTRPAAIDRATASPSSTSTSATTTRAPARASSSAIARPMPRAAPVTTASRPSSGGTSGARLSMPVICISSSSRPPASRIFQNATSAYCTIVVSRLAFTNAPSPMYGCAATQWTTASGSPTTIARCAPYTGWRSDGLPVRLRFCLPALPVRELVRLADVVDERRREQQVVVDPDVAEHLLRARAPSRSRSWPSPGSGRPASRASSAGSRARPTVGCPRSARYGVSASARACSSITCSRSSASAICSISGQALTHPAPQRSARVWSSTSSLDPSIRSFRLGPRGTAASRRGGRRGGSARTRCSATPARRRAA